MALIDDIGKLIENEEFKKHFKDAIMYRVKNYYKERIEKRGK